MTSSNEQIGCHKLIRWLILFAKCWIQNLKQLCKESDINNKNTEKGFITSTEKLNREMEEIMKSHTEVLELKSILREI